MDAPINVWNEVRVTADGISITLLSESAEGGAVVEDETWFTFAELQNQSPSAPISLNLSDETQSEFEEQRRLANIGLIHDSQESDNSQNLPEVGDVLIDENAPDWSAARPTVTVTEVLPDARCDEYVIQSMSKNRENSVVELDSQNFSDVNLAEVNSSYDESEPVVLAKYERGDSDEYAFPASRLSE